MRSAMRPPHEARRSEFHETSARVNVVKLGMTLSSNIEDGCASRLAAREQGGGHLVRRCSTRWTHPKRDDNSGAPFHSNVHVIMESSGLHAEANALDISPGGVRLLCWEPLPVGEVALLKFQIKTRRKVRIEEARGRVRRVQMDDDVWVIGLEFTAMLDSRTTPLLVHATMKRDHT